MTSYQVLRGFSFPRGSQIRERMRKGIAYEKDSYSVTRIEAGEIITESQLPADVLKGCLSAKNPILEKVKEGTDDGS